VDLGPLGEEGDLCFRALDQARVSYRRLDPAEGSTGCGHGEAVLLRSGAVPYRSQGPLVMTCPLAARLHLWEQSVLLPAAERMLGSRVESVLLSGAFSCRRVARSGRLSEHAFGRAVDIIGVMLEDGRRIGVLEHYSSAGAEGEFLREVFSRGCEMFDVALGPQFDRAHKDHFHFDVGGGRVCR